MKRARADVGDTFIIDRGYRLQSSIGARTFALSNICTQASRVRANSAGQYRVTGL